MGRITVDRSDKVMQSFQSSKPLKARLQDAARKQNITVSALIRKILQAYFENRDYQF